MSAMQKQSTIGKDVSFERIRRITGYLVKRSEMEKYYEGEAVLQNTVHLGGDNYRNAHLENRKVRAL